MATKVFMEALSPTMEEGRLVKWHKRDGDAVKTGETLAEVETDKAVMELVARADGVLRQVAVAEGQTVPVGSVVAVIAAPGEAVGQTAQTAAPTPAGRGEGGRAMPEPARSPTPAPTAVAVPADATRVKASPLAKRIAKDSGVDLKLVTGSGPGGRVVKRDLEEAGRGERFAALQRSPWCRPRHLSFLPSPRRCGEGRRSKTSPSPKSARRSRSGSPRPSVPSRTSSSRPRSTWSGPRKRATRSTGRWATAGKSRSTTLSSKPPPSRSRSTAPATPGFRTITSVTGQRCTSGWRSRWRTGSSRR